MAIAIDSKNNGSSAFSSSLSYSHTCTGINLGLVVSVATDSATVTATYNSVSMTEINHRVVTGGFIVYAFLLVNPSIGSNSISISASGASQVSACSVSYTGINQSGQPDNSTTAAISSNVTLSSSLTPIANNCWVIEAVGNDSSTVMAGAGTTLEAQEATFHVCTILDTNAAVSPPTSTTLVATTGAADNKASVIFSLSPFGTTASNLSLLRT